MNKASFNTWLFPSAFSDCIIKVSNVGGVSDENNDNDDDDDDVDNNDDNDGGGGGGDDDDDDDNKDVKTDKGHTIIVYNKLMIMTILMTNVKSGVR